MLIIINTAHNDNQDKAMLKNQIKAMFYFCSQMHSVYLPPWGTCKHDDPFEAPPGIYSYILNILSLPVIHPAISRAGARHKKSASQFFI